MKRLQLDQHHYMENNILYGEIWSDGKIRKYQYLGNLTWKEVEND